MQGILKQWKASKPNVTGSNGNLANNQWRHGQQSDVHWCPLSDPIESMEGSNVKYLDPMLQLTRSNGNLANNQCYGQQASRCPLGQLVSPC